MAKKEQPKKSQKPEKVDPQVADLLRRKQLEAMVAARTMTDAAFRKKFLADPKGTLKETLGVDLGKIKFVVHEETADTVHVSVPPFRKAGDELSDDELEAVAGGRGADPGSAFRGGRCAGYDGIASLGAVAGYSWLWNG